VVRPWARVGEVLTKGGKKETPANLREESRPEAGRGGAAVSTDLAGSVFRPVRKVCFETQSVIQ
jgi:hypothetical protein